MVANGRTEEKHSAIHLKQTGLATSRDAVRDYVAWAEGASLLFSVPIHTDSRHEQERNFRKVHCIDWALATRSSLVWDGSCARALENMVYLHLHRIYPRVRCHLAGNRRQVVDFLVSENRGAPVLAVQEKRTCIPPAELGYASSRSLGAGWRRPEGDESPFGRAGAG